MVLEVGCDFFFSDGWLRLGRDPLMGVCLQDFVVDVSEFVELTSFCWSCPVSAGVKILYCLVALVLYGLDLEKQVVFLFKYG